MGGNVVDGNPRLDDYAPALSLGQLPAALARGHRTTAGR